MNHPFFITWAKQSQACTIDIDRCDEFHYYDKEKSYLDLSSISYQASFGLKNDHIEAAITKQLGSFALASPKHLFSLKTQVSQKLLDNLGLTGKIFYTVSGAESVENALKLARQIRKANKVLVRKNCYHGATLGALSITGDWRHNDHATVDDWTIRIPDHLEDPEAKMLEQLIEKEGAHNIAAFCLETIVGGNGVFQAPKSWYKKVQELCDRHGILLILDEVICGFGRTGKYFGFHHYSFLKPNFVCLSKAISGGFIPFGALYINEKTSKYYDHHVLSAGLTNYAHPLGLAALNAVMDLLKEEAFWQHLKVLEEELTKFATLIQFKVKITRQSGLLVAIDLNKPIPMQTLLDHGLYMISQVDLSRLILAPILTIPEKKLKSGLTKLAEIIHAQ